ncbi:MAG: DnaD domain protein [Erysipelotrichaceae bacterium]|nr:DnaD domain protein [Erysipelotrichaceae bacterium]
MKKWYKESYFDSKNWILENFDKLGLNADETVVILLIDLYKKNRRSLSYDIFCEKLSRDAESVDKILSGLVDKHYLKIGSNAKGPVFDIESIYEFDPEKYEISENTDLYHQVEDIFGKMLSPTELQKMNDMINEYGQLKFMEALRVAEANRKVRMSYIEAILRNEKER